MRRLLLVAASGLATEVVAAATAAGSYDEFLIVDDDRRLWGSEAGGVPIVGAVEQAAEYPDHDLILCAGNGLVRRTLLGRLSAMGIRPERYGRVVHPSVELPADCVVGRGSVLLAHVALTAAVTVGNHVVVMPNTSLTHDDHVSDFATLCAGVTLGGRVLVCEGAYVGMNASVREGLSIGARSTLGMGSVLLEDLPPRETWAGIPAAPLATRTRELR
jgi:sugar O-acyltransferase (sialic acid O-acetyltransferase NeuD family)